jgi:hypothetical protein
MQDRSKGTNSPSGTPGAVMCRACRQGRPVTSCGIGNSLLNRNVDFTGERNWSGDTSGVCGSRPRPSMSTWVNSGSATNSGSRRSRNSSSGHSGFARYRGLLAFHLARMNFRSCIGETLNALTPTTRPIFRLVQLGPSASGVALSHYTLHRTISNL